MRCPLPITLLCSLTLTSTVFAQEPPAAEEPAAKAESATEAESATDHGTETPTVEQASDEPAEAKLTETPPARSPIQPWMFWTGVGVTGAAAVAAVVGAVLAKDSEADFNKLAAESVNGPVDGAELSDLEGTTNDRYAFANAMIATAAGFAAASALLWLATDFGDSGQTAVSICPTRDGAAIGFLTAF